MRTKKIVPFFVFIILSILAINIYLFHAVGAQEANSKSINGGQNLKDYSTQILYFINNDKYSQAKSVLSQMASYYLEISNKIDITIEGHKAYTEQLINVKNELAKTQINRELLMEESYKLHIASEVISDQDFTEFAKLLDEFYQSSVMLFETLQSTEDSNIAQLVKDVDNKFYLLSCAIQIAYPQEYHDQISSIINYMKRSTPSQVKEAKDAVKHLVHIVEKLLTHTKEANIQLVYATMDPKSYLLGISAVTAIAFMTVFWRKWKLVS